MNKNKWISVLLISLCVLILIGIGLMTYFLLNPTKGTTMIRLNLQDDVRKIVHFTDLTLVPGESSEYILLLSSELEDDYLITLHFSEIEDHLLKEFAFVRIESEGEILCDKRLSEVLNGEPVTCTRALSEDTEREIKVTYYLPADVGNEAERTASDFELMIIASNEGDIYE